MVKVDLSNAIQADMLILGYRKRR